MRTKNESVPSGMRAALVPLFALAAVSLVCLGAALYIMSEAMGRMEQEETAARALARADFAEAVGCLSDALADGQNNEAEKVNDAAWYAGYASGALTRAGYDGCERVYALLELLAQGSSELPPGTAERFAAAARDGEFDGGEALRALVAGEEIATLLSALSREDSESAGESVRGFRVFEYSGECGQTAAEAAVRRLTGKHALLTPCGGLSFPPSYAFAGTNIYVRVSSDGSSVLEYCFDRDPDLSRDAGYEAALSSARAVIVQEKYEGLADEPELTFSREGVFRFVWRCTGDKSEECAVTVEIYADTCTLRRLDAMNYYRDAGE